MAPCGAACGTELQQRWAAAGGEALQAVKLVPQRGGEGKLLQVVWAKLTWGCWVHTGSHRAPETLSTTKHSRARLRLADRDSCFLPLGQLDRSSCRSAPLCRFWETLCPTFPNRSSVSLRLLAGPHCHWARI